MQKIQMLIVLAVAIGAAWLTTLVDNGLGTCWTQAAVRNWEQFGLLNLHGKIVCNNGGFQAETHPYFYPGHRPASLYPVFLCYHLLVATGLGFLVYYAVIAALVLMSIWWLLGRTDRAFWLAAITVITPGYLRWQTTLDPNLTAVLIGFPFCAAVIELLRRPVLNLRQILLLFVLILFFSALNWTTVFVHAMLFATLLILPRVPWRHILIYAGLTAIMAGAVLLVSVSSKMSQPDGSSVGLVSMLQAYGWGNLGYGTGMTTRTALMRLVAVNLMGLLPVLICLGWQWWQRAGRLTAAGMLFCLPALVSAMEILGMRNYFGHHPWMSVNFFLLGLILAATAWKARAETPSGENNIRPPARLAWLGAVFVYSFIVLAIGHAHIDRELAFVTFIRAHTSRDTTIIIRRDTDPALVGLSPRLDELFDRHLVVVPGIGENSLADLSAKRVILTVTAPPSGKILAQTAGAAHPSPVVQTLLGWYSRYVARRLPGDQLVVGDQFFLYQPAN
jgi:hypothetical protein